MQMRIEAPCRERREYLRSAGSNHLREDFPIRNPQKALTLDYGIGLPEVMDSRRTGACRRFRTAAAACLIGTLAVVLLPAAALLRAEDMTAGALKAMGAPHHPKAEIAWNRYYDTEGIADICTRLAKAHPDLVRFSSIGKSVQGRDIPLLTVTDFSSGDPDEKPAMYIDGNIHSNEIQGAEVALYTAWYLAESRGQVEWITGLLKEKTFYILPTINPDARDKFIHESNMPHSPRSGLLPRDDDGDGLTDEDGFDDLDGDGNIVMMRKLNPAGRWKDDPDDPRLMVECREDETGRYDFLGWEGIDNDGDGRINEDGPGYYDPNRNWAWNWQPSYVQFGSDQYPFSIPENRAVADFVMAHPNIAGAQSYHNSGGLIVRGPGQKSDDSYDPADVRVYDFLGKLGAEMLPGYQYVVLERDMYPVWGGELDWFYGVYGIFTFTNELWTSFDYFRKKDETTGWFGEEKESYRFDKLLLFGEGVVPWKKFRHPQYGDIEIGGLKKAWTRTAPSFLMEEMCHRNAAFTLFHAFHLPLLRADSASVSSLGGSLYQVDVTVRNLRVMPSRSTHEIRVKSTVPDFAMLKPVSGKVVAGFIVEDPYLRLVREQKYRPDRLAVDAVPGMNAVRVRWLVEGRGPWRFVYESKKGGRIEKTIE